MPDPIQWGPCDALASTSLKCQQMVFTWDPMGQVSGFPKFYEDPVHGPTFFINRYQGVQSKGNTGVYAEVDGSVLWAMMLPDATSQSCRFWTDAATPTNRFVLNVTGEYSDREGGHVGVILAGLNEAPRVALRRPELSIGANWFASDSWVVELGGLGFTARPWDFNSFFKPGLSPPEPSTATSAHKLQVLGDSIFHASQDGTDGSVSVWTPETGNRYLLREPGVNFDNFATDGKDMVWSRLEGLISTTPPYDYKKKELWTAPFTTKREDLEKTARRVTTARAAVSLRPWVVGCGFTAISFSDDEYSKVIQVVRLSDGQTWIVDREGIENFMWGRTIGLTCSELFTNMTNSGKSTIARIRLDSLGEGNPPN